MNDTNYTFVIFSTILFINLNSCGKIIFIYLWGSILPKHYTLHTNEIKQAREIKLQSKTIQTGISSESHGAFSESHRAFYFPPALVADHSLGPMNVPTQ